jgi:hypothetical protein
MTANPMQTQAKNKLGLILNPIEKEVLLLRSSLEAISFMVNNALLLFSTGEHGTEVRPNTFSDLPLFNIILTDFLSPPEDYLYSGQDSYLTALQVVGNGPSFNDQGSINELKESVSAFLDWLNQPVQHEKVWLPSINQELSITMKRVEYLKICGNLAKHHLPTTQALKIFKILVDNGAKLEKSDSFLVLDEFYEWFHTDKLAYHLSTICEHLNTIRWGIHDYLRPQFQKSYVPGEWPYSYNVPETMASNFSQACYWDLMNKIRSEPYIPRFKAPHCLKLRD